MNKRRSPWASHRVDDWMELSIAYDALQAKFTAAHIEWAEKLNNEREDRQREVERLNAEIERLKKLYRDGFGQ